MTKLPPSPSLRDRQRQEREHLILEAAEQLIVEKGYYETSIDDIALRVGIAKGTVYLHFPSKEALATTLLEHTMQHFLESVDAILATDQSPDTKLRSILATVLQDMASTHFKLLLTLAQNVELQNHFVDKKQILIAKRALLAEHINAVFTEGQSQGIFDTTIPASVLTNIFWSMLSPRNNELMTQEHLTPNELINYISRFFFHGVAAQTA